jgi:hypothetical protein
MRKISPNRSKRCGYGGAITYLRVENPCFLFLGGPTDDVAAAGVATASPPVVPAARAGASMARVASLVGCLAAGAPAPAPGIVSPAASAALGEGVRAPTSRGEPVSRPSPPPPRPTTSTPKSRCWRAPAARGAGTPHSSVPSAPIAGSCSPSCAPPALAPAAAPRARARARGVGGSDRAAFTAITCRGASETPDHDGAPRTKRPKRGGNPTHQRALGEHGERPKRGVVGPYGLEVDGAPRPRGGRRDYASATGSTVSSISKMQSRLSMRGTIRR